MMAVLPVCEALQVPCQYLENGTDPTKLAEAWSACLNAYEVCNIAEIEPVQLSGYNVYDVRKKCDPRLPLCYNFTLVTDYLNLPAVQTGLGVNRPWADCDRRVELKMVFAGDWMLDYEQDVALLLESNVRVLIYAGEYDFICNWEGNFAWTMGLEWPGQMLYEKAANMTWSVGGTPAGMVKAVNASNNLGSFTFLKVFNAGHMVPMDQPINALDMVRRFLSNEPFTD